MSPSLEWCFSIPITIIGQKASPDMHCMLEHSMDRGSRQLNFCCHVIVCVHHEPHQRCLDTEEILYTDGRYPCLAFSLTNLLFHNLTCLCEWECQSYQAYTVETHLMLIIVWNVCKPNSHITAHLWRKHMSTAVTAKVINVWCRYSFTRGLIHNIPLSLPIVVWCL